jgi:hypothetical protein
MALILKSIYFMKSLINAIIFFVLFSIAHASDAADMQTTVQLLNQDWNNTTRQTCQIGDPDYYCSGVIIHVFDMLSLMNLVQNSPSLSMSSYKPWMPSQRGIQKGSVSFSYLRRDIAIKNSLYPGDILAGYIFIPISRLKKNHALLYNPYCEYPMNAGTNSIDNKGCGSLDSFQKKNQHRITETDLGTCKALDIDTPEKYVHQKPPYPGAPICSVSPDQTGFNLMIDTIKYLKENPNVTLPNNEVVIKEWSDFSDNVVPIEAFFYITQDLEHKGEIAANNAAALYKDATGDTVPVVKIDIQKLDQGAADPFVAP